MPINVIAGSGASGSGGVGGGGVTYPAALYNPGGLSHARTRLAKWTPLGKGGMGILWGGDSINAGGVNGGAGTATLANYLYGGAAHLLKVKLQAKYNPSGVRGGYGYLKMLTGLGGDQSWLAGPNVDDVWTVAGTASRGDGTGFLNDPAQVRLQMSGATARFAFLGDSAPASQRNRITSFEPMYVRNGGFAPLVLDISGTNAAITPGSGTVTVSLNVDGTNAFGIHHGTAIGLGTLTPGNLNVVQYGPNGTSGDRFPEGGFAYDGDETCGVQVHQTANWGSTTADWIDAANGSATNGMVANIDRFGDMSGLSSTRAGLFVFNLVTNDASQGVAVATFKANYRTLVMRALACPSKPSVLLIIPPVRAALTPAQYQPYVTAIYQIADEFFDDVAILDMWSEIGNAAHGTSTAGAVFAKGWYGDGTHFNAQYQSDVSDRVLSAVA